MVSFLKNVFRPVYEVFWQRIRKLWTLEKLETMMKKVFFEKKSFHLFKSLLYKNGKAQNMSVIAGRPVAGAKWLIFSRWICWIRRKCRKYDGTTCDRPIICQTITVMKIGSCLVQMNLFRGEILYLRNWGEFLQILQLVLQNFCCA